MQACVDRRSAIRTSVAALLAAAALTALSPAALAQCPTGWLSPAQGAPPAGLGAGLLSPTHVPTVSAMGFDAAGRLVVARDQQASSSQSVLFTEVLVLDNGSWTRLGASGFIPGTRRTVSSIVTLPSGDLVIGALAPLADPAAYVARWNGTAWEQLPGGTLNGIVYSLLVLPNGDLLASGRFSQIGATPINRIARWSNGVWSPLPVQLPELSTPGATSLVRTPTGELFYSTWTEVYRFDGTSWSLLPARPDCFAESQAVGSPLVVLANGSVAVAGRNCVNVWSGSAWVALPTIPAGAQSRFISTIAALPDGGLVAGLSLVEFGGTGLVLRFRNGAWEELGGASSPGAFGRVVAVLPLPGGDFLVGGSFPAQGMGGASAEAIARYSVGGVVGLSAQPQPATVAAGQTASLSATPVVGYAERPGGLSYQWVRAVGSGTTLPGSGGTVVTGASGTITTTAPITLTLGNVQQADAGQYRLVLSGVCGSAVSEPATLTVTGCYANCDGSTTFPSLNAVDFGCFLNRFRSAAGLPAAQQAAAYANCDGSTTFPQLNALDFSCFLNRYRAGCN